MYEWHPSVRVQQCLRLCYRPQQKKYPCKTPAEPQQQLDQGSTENLRNLPPSPTITPGL